MAIYHALLCVLQHKLTGEAIDERDPGNVPDWFQDHALTSQVHRLERWLADPNHDWELVEVYYATCSCRHDEEPDLSRATIEELPWEP